MITPGVHDITIYTNADFDLTFTLEDSSSDPYSLVGATVLAQIWNEDGTAKIDDFTVTVTDAANGTFKISLTEIETAALSAGGWYDIRIDDGTDIYYWVRGKVTLATGYTS